MKGKLITALVAAVLAGAAFIIFTHKQMAPEVRFMTLAGESIMTSQLRGKVVLVNFWATSCSVCLREMPRLIATHRRFDGERFETIAVAMEYDPPNRVKAYADAEALPFKVALDAGGLVAKAFGDVRATPTTYLINKRGEIVRKYLGEPDFAALRAVVLELLAETG